MTSPIRAERLSKVYRDVTAVDGLNLEVPAGGILGLIGPNGAGKSTAIKILMNIIRQDSGRTQVLGVDSSELSARELARIGYVSEDQALPGWMTVAELMAYLRPFYPSWDPELATELLGMFHLPTKARVSELSRGMRMKAALVSSLAYRPEVLILDEPFAGLDALIRDELIEGVLAAAEHATMLISSHDLTEIESFISHAAYLDHGRLWFCEEMASLANRFRTMEVVTAGVGAPETLPQHWVSVERAGNCVRWVDPQFQPERSAEEISRVFGSTVEVEAKPMALRSIFVTMAKISRGQE